MPVERLYERPDAFVNQAVSIDAAILVLLFEELEIEEVREDCTQSLVEETSLFFILTDDLIF